MKVADVRCVWRKSPSQDIVKAEFVWSVNDGPETTLEVGPEIEKNTIVVPAGGKFAFRVTVTDREGKTATSESYTHTLGDLVDPLPPTDLGHEVVSVRDETPEPGPEPTPPVVQRRK